MRPVIEWDTNKHLGEIPEVAHTYSTVGNMNEHGLVIAESTWGGREELAGTGIIDYGSLIYITLQRAKTSRTTATPRQESHSRSPTPMRCGSWTLSARGRRPRTLYG